MGSSMLADGKSVEPSRNYPSVADLVNDLMHKGASTEQMSQIAASQNFGTETVGLYLQFASGSPEIYFSNEMQPSEPKPFSNKPKGSAGEIYDCLTSFGPMSVNELVLEIPNKARRQVQRAATRLIKNNLAVLRDGKYELAEAANPNQGKLRYQMDVTLDGFSKQDTDNELAQGTKGINEKPQESEKDADAETITDSLLSHIESGDIESPYADTETVASAEAEVPAVQTVRSYDKETGLTIEECALLYLGDNESGKAGDVKTALTGYSRNAVEQRLKLMSKEGLAKRDGGKGTLPATTAEEVIEEANEELHAMQDAEATHSDNQLTGDELKEYEGLGSTARIMRYIENHGQISYAVAQKLIGKSNHTTIHRMKNRGELKRIGLGVYEKGTTEVEMKRVRRVQKRNSTRKINYRAKIENITNRILPYFESVGRTTLREIEGEFSDIPYTALRKAVRKLVRKRKILRKRGYDVHLFVYNESLSKRFHRQVIEIARSKEEFSASDFHSRFRYPRSYYISRLRHLCREGVLEAVDVLDGEPVYRLAKLQGDAPAQCKNLDEAIADYAEAHGDFTDEAISRSLNGRYDRSTIHQRLSSLLAKGVLKKEEATRCFLTGI